MGGGEDARYLLPLHPREKEGAGGSFLHPTGTGSPELLSDTSVKGWLCSPRGWRPPPAKPDEATSPLLLQRVRNGGRDLSLLTPKLINKTLKSYRE